MGQYILEKGGLIVRSTCIGQPQGFPRATPAIALSTGQRANVMDYVVLSEEEAVLIAQAILGKLRPSWTIKT